MIFLTGLFGPSVELFDHSDFSQWNILLHYLDVSIRIVLQVVSIGTFYHYFVCTCVRACVCACVSVCVCLKLYLGMHWRRFMIILNSINN